MLATKTIDVTHCLDALLSAVVADRSSLARLSGPEALRRLRESRACRDLEYEVNVVLNEREGLDADIHELKRRLRDLEDRLDDVKGDRDSAYEKCRKLEDAVDDAVRRLKGA